MADPLTLLATQKGAEEAIKIVGEVGKELAKDPNFAASAGKSLETISKGGVDINKEVISIMADFLRNNQDTTLKIVSNLKLGEEGNRILKYMIDNPEHFAEHYGKAIIISSKTFKESASIISQVPGVVGESLAAGLGQTAKQSGVAAKEMATAFAEYGRVSPQFVKGVITGVGEAGAEVINQIGNMIGTLQNTAWHTMTWGVFKEGGERSSPNKSFAFGGYASGYAGGYAGGYGDDQPFDIENYIEKSGGYASSHASREHCSPNKKSIFGGNNLMMPNWAFHSVMLLLTAVFLIAIFIYFNSETEPSTTHTTVIIGSGVLILGMLASYVF